MLFLLSLGSCGKKLEGCNPPQCYRIEGEISRQHIEAVFSLRSDLELIVIDSPGGVATVGAALGLFVLDYDLSIIIDGMCASACAEYVLTAAKDVQVSSGSLILFHDSAEMIQAALRRRGRKDFSICSFKPLDVQRRIFKERNLRLEFYRDVEMRIGELEIETSVNENGCLILRGKKNELDFWIPNSSQIESLLGVQIDGILCADDVDVCRQRLIQLGRQKRCVLVDEEVPC